MKINILQWRYSPFLILLPLLLPIGNANAANLPNVTCTAGMNTTAGSTGIVNLGTITAANANTANVDVQLNYSCTHNGTNPGFVTLCFGVDGGYYNQNDRNPRYMSQGITKTPTLPRLAFNMTHSGGSIWGTRSGGTGTEYKTSTLTINPGDTIKGSVPIRIGMVGVNNNLATYGTYNSDFASANVGYTALTYDANSIANSANCSTGGQQSNRFPFKVTARVAPSCLITSTSDIALPSGPAGRTNIEGFNQSAIAVNCTNDAPYYIGLSPSNGDMNGAGVMTGTLGNGDEISYQLRSTAGLNGTIWGNTATYPIVGNGITSKGTGSPKSHAVYVTVPNTDVKPDNYSDTVTINVNY